MKDLLGRLVDEYCLTMYKLASSTGPVRGAVIAVYMSMAEALTTGRMPPMVFSTLEEMRTVPGAVPSELLRLSETYDPETSMVVFVSVSMDKKALRLNHHDAQTLACVLEYPSTQEGASPGGARFAPWTPDPSDFEAYMNTKLCTQCGGTAPGGKVCGGCKAARYCSKRCQKAAWKGGHKAKCEELSVVKSSSKAGSRAEGAVTLTLTN